MGEFFWKLRGPAGEDAGESERFAAQEEAEAWMGTHWSRLLDEGAETVSLVRDEDVLYDMGLREA
jgi:hypothetical protein